MIPCLSSAFLAHDRNFQFISSVHSLYLFCILLRNDRVKEVMMIKKRQLKRILLTELLKSNVRHSAAREICRGTETDNNCTNPWSVLKSLCGFVHPSVRPWSVMPRSHIHESSRRFYYGLNLTDDPGNANFCSLILMPYYV